MPDDATSEAAEQGQAPAAPQQEQTDLIASMLARMQLEVDAAQQGGKRSPDLSMYTEDALKQRADLLRHPTVVQALEDLWQASNTTDDDIIDYLEYLEMHR